MVTEEPPHSSDPPAGQLAGVRVVDLTTVVMGPMATRMLADMGADVIKVETKDGDLMRHYPPSRNPQMSGITLNLDRNKRSIVLNLKDPDDHHVLLDLIATADVFVTNMRSGALDRLGLTYDHVRAHREDIVYCMANGFDSQGPWADRPAYDDVVQAMSGLASMFTWSRDEPAFVPSIVADKTVALHVVNAILAGLFKRAVSGMGDNIEVPMTETLAAFNLVEHLNGHTFEPPEGPFSYERVRTPNRKPRPTADGFVALLPYSAQNWKDVFAFGGRPELADDPRFGSRPDRVTNADALYEILNQLTTAHTTAAWLDYCEEHAIPAAPITDLRELRDNAYFSQVELLKDAEHPSEGSYKVIADPIRSRHKQSGLRHHAPQVGQHSEEIRSELQKD